MNYVLLLKPVLTCWRSLQRCHFLKLRPITQTWSSDTRGMVSVECLICIFGALTSPKPMTEDNSMSRWRRKCKYTKHNIIVLVMTVFWDVLEVPATSMIDHIHCFTRCFLTEYCYVYSLCLRVLLSSKHFPVLLNSCNYVLPQRKRRCFTQLSTRPNRLTEWVLL